VIPQHVFNGAGQARIGQWRDGGGILRKIVAPTVLRLELVSRIRHGKSGAISKNGFGHDPDAVTRYSDNAFYKHLAAVNGIVKHDDIAARRLNPRKNARQYAIAN
jgi:hypothetical protein